MLYSKGQTVLQQKSKVVGFSFFFLNIISKSTSGFKTEL